MKLRIKEVIREKGLSVAKVAELMEVQQTSLSRIINGGNTTVEMLEKIAKALDVEIVELFEQKLNESDLFGVIIFEGKTYKIDSKYDLTVFLADYLEKNPKTKTEKAQE